MYNNYKIAVDSLFMAIFFSKIRYADLINWVYYVVVVVILYIYYNNKDITFIWCFDYFCENSKPKNDQNTYKILSHFKICNKYCS